MGIAAIAAPQTSHHAALDAHASVWVSASAGSGKTTLLTKRVVALLLDGVAPSSILCLTYTKNAAAEMHTRVMAMLRGWLTLSDDALRTLLANDLGRPHTSLTEARGLYMKLLTAPRGVALQTIHSFCEGLLRQFPLEAGLPPTFTIMDTATQNELLRQALDSLYTAATRLPALRATLQQFAQDSAQSTFEESLADILTKHRTLRAMTERYATLAEYQAALEKALGLPSTVTIDDIRQRIMADRPLPLLREWYEKARAAPKAKKKQTFAEAITPFLADTPALASPEDYATCFLTQAHTPLKQIFDDDTRFFTEAERIASLLQQQKAVQSRDKASAYYTIGQAILQAYTALKHAHGAYDFDDMIQHTLTLLHNSDMAQWVRFKLDAKLAHILVDEAQDTSQELWQLVDALTSDFFTQADTPRSLFVVGDFKQSIYSFQGAEPAIFQQQRTLYQEKVKASRRPWVDVRLDTCYRSAPTLLRFVDTVFDTPQSRQALGLDDERLHHSPARGDDGTIIEVWPPFDKAEIHLSLIHI
jgi:ATP-dependent helicase/nuclease subunit A